MSSEPDFELGSALKLGAVVLNARKDAVKAGNIFRKCIAKCPDDFRAYFNLGTVLDAPGETQDYEGAARSFRSAILCDGRVIESYGCLSGVLLKLGRPEEAARVCMDGLLIIPTDPPCLYNFNVALRQVSCIDSAINFSIGILKNSYSVDVDCENATVSESGSIVPESSRRTPSEPRNHGIVFICVKWGSKYGPEYVNAMYYALKRHWTRGMEALRLVCITDDDSDIIPAVECKPFPSAAIHGKWRTWWLKASIFSSALMEDLGVKNQESSGSWMLYLDLDTVICGNLDFLSTHRDSIDWKAYETDTLCTFGTSIFANECRKQGINSSMLLWFEHPRELGSSEGTTRGLPSLYSLLERHYNEVVSVIYKFDHFLEMFLSRRGIHVVHLEKSIPAFMDFHGVVNSSGIPSSCDLATIREQLGVVMVCFPLEPKPKAVLEDFSWISEYLNELL